MERFERMDPYRKEWYIIALQFPFLCLSLEHKLQTCSSFNLMGLVNMLKSGNADQLKSAMSINITDPLYVRDSISQDL